MAKSQSTTTIELPNKNEFKKFYTLQNNDIRLQKEAKSYLKELIQLLKTCSTGVKELNEQWFDFNTKNQKKVSEYETIWELLYDAISSIDGFTDQIDNTVEQLEHVEESIRKPDEDQTLKAKINQARVEIEQLDKQINQLKIQKANSEKEIANKGKSASRNMFSCIAPEQNSEELIQQQLSIDTSIEKRSRQLEKKLRDFDKRKKRLYEESKEQEIKRCENLKEQSTALLRSFGIESDDYNRLSQAYNAKNNLRKWEKQNLPQNSNFLLKSQSMEEATPADDD